MPPANAAQIFASRIGRSQSARACEVFRQRTSSYRTSFLARIRGALDRDCWVDRSVRAGLVRSDPPVSLTLGTPCVRYLYIGRIVRFSTRNFFGPGQSGPRTGIRPEEGRYLIVNKWLKRMIGPNGRPGEDRNRGKSLSPRKSPGSPVSAQGNPGTPVVSFVALSTSCPDAP